MNDAATTKRLLETYYRGLSGKKRWESVLSDSFKFTGGNMMQPGPLFPCF